MQAHPGSNNPVVRFAGDYSDHHGGGGRALYRAPDVITVINVIARRARRAATPCGNYINCGVRFFNTPRSIKRNGRAKHRFGSYWVRDNFCDPPHRDADPRERQFWLRLQYVERVRYHQRSIEHAERQRGRRVSKRNLGGPVLANTIADSTVVRTFDSDFGNRRCSSYLNGSSRILLTVV